ncbi:hypothetical protein AUL38_15925 [Leucobacter sp. G161]|nr:hypothetical protein AUL38_15925 [Leucobacter sp. G161]
MWETDQVDVISQRSDVYSETFTISGMTVNGVAYELPTSAPHMAGSGSLFSQLGGKLPDGALVFDTPDTMPDAPNSGSNRRAQPAGLGNQVKLLPTATAADSNASGGSSESNVTLTDAVVRTELGTVPNSRLLPTPDAYAGSRGGAQDPGKRRAGGHSVALHDGIEKGGLLPTPKAGDADFGMPRTSGRPPEKSTHLMTRMEYTKPESSWGPYATAIERWETVLGRPAPEPTEVGPKGGRRLSAAFVEWMMGLPESWVTDPTLGLSRTQQLKMLGNGVVTQQAVTALKSMGVHASGKDL